MIVAISSTSSTVRSETCPSAARTPPISIRPSPGIGDGIPASSMNSTIAIGVSVCDVRYS
jgi:hypothetical protein